MPHLLTPSGSRAWPIAPALLFPKAALFLLSLLPLLMVKTLLHTALFGTEHLPALIYWSAYGVVFFCFICLFSPFHFSLWKYMILAFYLICGCPAACYASHAASRLAVSGASALHQCKVSFSCESDWRNWALLCNYCGRGRTSVFEAPDQWGCIKEMHLTSKRKHFSHVFCTVLKSLARWVSNHWFRSVSWG